MALCDCGQLTARLKMRCTTPDGTPLPPPWKSVCPWCAPDEFQQGRIQGPAEKRVWLMADVNPNEYERHGEGPKVMKDWAQGEFEERFGREDPPDVEAIERAKQEKRQHAAQVRALYGTQLDAAKVNELRAALDEGGKRAIAGETGLVLP